MPCPWTPRNWSAERCRRASVGSSLGSHRTWCVGFEGVGGVLDRHEGVQHSPRLGTQYSPAGARLRSGLDRVARWLSDASHRLLNAAPSGCSSNGEQKPPSSGGAHVVDVFRGGCEDGPCGHCVAEEENLDGRFLDGFEEGGPCVVLLVVTGEDIARKRKVGLDWRATGIARRARSAHADTSRQNPDGGRTRACRRTARTCTLRRLRSGRRDAIARGLCGSEGEGAPLREVGTRESVSCAVPARYPGCEGADLVRTRASAASLGFAADVPYSILTM